MEPDKDKKAQEAPAPADIAEKPEGLEAKSALEAPELFAS